MIELILNNWMYFVLVLAAIFEVIASIVVIVKTPKNKVLTAFKEVVVKLPSFIQEAESLLVGANKKKIFVIKRCISLISEITGFKDSKIEKLYFNDITKLIEDILSTPQKKGI